MKYTEQQLTTTAVSDNLRPVLAGSKAGAPLTLWYLIQKCWDSKPENRPSFDDIVAELTSISEHRERTRVSLILGGNPISLSDKAINFSNNVQAFQEAVNWSTQGEYFSRRAACKADSSLTIWTDSLDAPSAYRPVLSWGSFATCGRRETMEDTHFLMPHLNNAIDVHVFGLFDGHRGTYATTDFK